jgi:hypothetical protein
MAEQRTAVVVANVVAFLLYALLVVAAFYVILFSGLVFGMSTDACHDAACDASYHVGAAIGTVWIGVGVVMIATAVAMVRGVTRGSSIVLIWPFVGLLGLGLVAAIGLAVVH